MQARFLSKHCLSNSLPSVTKGFAMKVFAKVAMQATHVSFTPNVLLITTVARFKVKA